MSEYGGGDSSPNPRAMQQQYPNKAHYPGETLGSCQLQTEMTMMEKVTQLMHRVAVLEKLLEDQTLTLARRSERIERIVGIGPKD